MAILLNSNIVTKTNTAVLKEIEPLFGEAVNLNSVSKSNQKILKLYKEAVDKIYRSIEAKDEDDIIFLSSANEAASQIYLSMYLNYILTGRKNSIILFSRANITELKLARFLESQGCRVYRIPATIDGTIDLEILREYINSKTALVSVPMVDEESGVIQPIEEISAMCKMQNVPLFCDATHAIGKIPVSVQRDEVSYLCFDGKTIGAPKDTAALYINKDAPQLLPLIYAKDTEQGGLRANLDPVKVIGFGKALEIAIDALDFDIEDVRELRDYLETELLKIDNSYSLAPWAIRVPNIAIMAFEGVHASMLLNELAKEDIEAYSFAVFDNRNFERQSLIEIANLSNSLKHTVVGFSLSAQNTKEEIDKVIKVAKEAIEKIRTNYSGEICKEDK